MKLTKSQLKHIIKEELLKEGVGLAGRVADQYGKGSFTDKGLGGTTEEPEEKPKKKGWSISDYFEPDDTPEDQKVKYAPGAEAFEDKHGGELDLGIPLPETPEFDIGFQGVIGRNIPGGHLTSDANIRAEMAKGGWRGGEDGRGGEWMGATDYDTVETELRSQVRKARSAARAKAEKSRWATRTLGRGLDWAEEKGIPGLSAMNRWTRSEPIFEKLTKRQLKEMIKEEMQVTLDEAELNELFGWGEKEPPAPEPVDCKEIRADYKVLMSTGRMPVDGQDWIDKMKKETDCLDDLDFW